MFDVVKEVVPSITQPRSLTNDRPQALANSLTFQGGPQSIVKSVIHRLKGKHDSERSRNVKQAATNGS
jgi:hypothetical protein